MNTLDAIDALLISAPTNIRYLTGFAGAAPAEREAYVLITKTKKYFFTHSLYLEQAGRLGQVDVVEITREHPLSARVVALTNTHEIKSLGFEDQDLTVGEYNKLKEALTTVILVPTRERIETKRQIKQPNELSSIRAAAKLTDDCFSELLPTIKPGITEQKLAWSIESYFKLRGATLAFPPIVAFNAHSSMPHYDGQENATLQPNSIVLLDFAARVNGYCADMTRVVFVGKPKDEWVRAYAIILDAQKKTLDYLASTKNPSGSEADRTARSHIEKNGLVPYPHSLGHGVGLDIHETPRLTMKQEYALTPGMVFSVEPAVYLPGEYGIRIEDLVLLTDTGLEILSKMSKEIIYL